MCNCTAECACPLPLQVLLSIQGMILIGDPYFNEPSVEQMRSTAQGASTCVCLKQQQQESPQFLLPCCVQICIIVVLMLLR